MPKNFIETLSVLIDRLQHPDMSAANVISWSSPVPAFGDPKISSVATVGLNPSNLEFVDNHGRELDGTYRRLPTLRSLGLSGWADVRPAHLDIIREACHFYFSRKPYDSWFRRLDCVISGTNASFYEDMFSVPSSRACHLDLIAYATACKWTQLSKLQRTLLLEANSDTLSQTVGSSAISLIVLNGQSVVDAFEHVANVELKKTRMEQWDLPRKSGRSVPGVAFSGEIAQLGGRDLPRAVEVLGFNHNLQSSFGVTKSVTDSIRGWIARKKQVGEK